MLVLTSYNFVHVWMVIDYTICSNNLYEIFFEMNFRRLTIWPEMEQQKLVTKRQHLGANSIFNKYSFLK